MKHAKQKSGPAHHHAHMRHAARSEAPLYAVRRSRIHGSGVQGARGGGIQRRLAARGGHRLPALRLDEAAQEGQELRVVVHQEDARPDHEAPDDSTGQRNAAHRSG